MIEQAGDDPRRRYRLLAARLADREAFARVLADARPASGRAPAVQRGSAGGCCSTPCSSSGCSPASAAPWNSPAALPPRSTPAAARAARLRRAGARGDAGVQLSLDGPAPPTTASCVALGARRARAHAHRGAHRPRVVRQVPQRGRQPLVDLGRPAPQRGHARLPGTGAPPRLPAVGGAGAATATWSPSPPPQAGTPRWTAQVLGVSAAEGAGWPGCCSTGCASRDGVGLVHDRGRRAVFAIPPTGIRRAAADRRRRSRPAPSAWSATPAATPCPASATVIDQLDGAPCLVARCPGQRSHGRRDRTTSTGSSTPRPTCAGSSPASTPACSTTRPGSRTRTSSRQPRPTPQAPNVLVATPTLEMGIDIGDLSTVMLASLPRTRRVLPAAGRPRRAPHRQRARPRLRHRPRRAAAQARRPAVGDQRRRSARRRPTWTPRRSCAGSHRARSSTAGPRRRRAAPRTRREAHRSPPTPGTFLGDAASPTPSAAPTNSSTRSSPRFARSTATS